MERHALVIGAALEAPATGLAAEDNDAERMTAMLSGRGFEVEQLRGPAATRSGILAGYRELVGRVHGGDAAVVYYAGHGGMLIHAEQRRDERALPRRLQYIAPTDYAQTTEDDFRGISDWELGLLLEQLTEKTDNVTVILDCCHAAQMSRDRAAAGAAPRAIHRPIRIDIGKHHDWVCRNVGPVDRLSPRGNPWAVRLVACGEWQSAYHTVDGRGRPTGLFTHELLVTLDEIGEAAVSWRAAGAAVRTRVLRKVPAQRPIVEGPARRRLFSTHEVDRVAISIARQQDERVRIDAGRIAGVSVGDLYGVTRIGATGCTRETEIARVKVEHVEALHAIARRIEGAGAALPEGAIAWPLELALARHPVRIDAPADEHAALAAALARSARLRVAGGGERAVGELRVRGGTLAVIAGDGRPLERGAGAWGIPGAVRQLDHLAAAQTLRELEGEHGLEDEEVEIEWGTVHRGVRIPRPAHGAALGLGDRIYLRLRNRTQAVRFAHVFNLGLRGKITLLSAAAGAGIRLGPEQEVLVPTPDSSSGFELVWPDDTPADEPGVDTLMVIVTAQAAELQALETDDPRGARGRALAAGSPLQRLMGQLHEGGTRGAGPAAKEPFFVARRSYVLHPLQAAIAGPGFAADEDPLAMHAALRPEVWVGGATWRARPVEIRLRELSAARAVRIDALVCTRSADPAGVYQARTLRFAAEGPHGGELLWRGPVRDLLDIYLWAAPDRGERGLAELLAPALARADVGEALDALVVRDDAAPWSLAGGASMALARAAGELLRDAAPGTAGLLHTSFAAHERYGIGRQPATGLYRGEGVTFGLWIADLEAAGGAAAR